MLLKLQTLARQTLKIQTTDYLVFLRVHLTSTLTHIITFSISSHPAVNKQDTIYSNSQHFTAPHCLPFGNQKEFPTD
jgi:hypothetical protein